MVLHGCGVTKLEPVEGWRMYENDLVVLVRSEKYMGANERRRNGAAAKGFLSFSDWGHLENQVPGIRILGTQNT